jgi:PAS domain-containing protein
MAGSSAAQKPLPRLLLCSDKHDSALAMQGAVLRDAGYPVQTTATSRGIQEHFHARDFEIVIFNHSLAFSDRKALARKIKQLRPQSGVLVLHHSGALENPYVDLAIDSRLGPKAVLRALERVERMLHARSHRDDGFSGDYFVAADANRNYTFVSDAACDLLGYDRAMFLELRIDDVVDGSTVITDPLFRQFVNDGEQAGRITLRHRSGKLVPVSYRARVEADGCMLALWEPLAERAAG